MRAGPRRGPLASEGRGSGLVAGLRDGSDNVLDRNAFDVVVDLDAGGGEMDLHVLDTLQASDLLLDLGHAGGAGESFVSQDGVGVGRVGHCGILSLLFLTDAFSVGSPRRRHLDLDLVRTDPDWSPKPTGSAREWNTSEIGTGNVRA